MANVRNANTFYVDTQSSSSADDLLIQNIRVTRAFVTATSANAVITLQDAASTPVTKITLDVATANSTSSYDFTPDGVVFPNGIKVSTLTNCVATLIIRESRG